MDPPDLSMYVSGALPPWVLSKVVVVGEPNAFAVLLAGIDPVIQEIPNVVGSPLLVEPLVKIVLGTIPADGILQVDPSVVPTLPPGSVILFQAYSEREDGTQFLSNSTGLTQDL